MTDPAVLRELEAELNAARGAHEAALRHVQWLGLSGRPGIRDARNRVARTNLAALRAQDALDRARLGMGA